MSKIQEIRDALIQFRDHQYPLVLSATGGKGNGPDDGARALYSFLQVLADGREDTIVATAEEAVERLRVYVQQHGQIKDGLSKPVASGGKRVAPATLTIGHKVPSIPKVQPQLEPDRTSFNKRADDDLGQSTLGKRSYATTISDDSEGDLPPLDFGNSTPTPKRTRTAMPTTPRATGGRIDMLSSAQKNISDAIMNSPKRSTRKVLGKGKEETVLEMGESSKGTSTRRFGAGKR